MLKEIGVSYRESTVNFVLNRSPSSLLFELSESVINNTFIQYPNNSDDHSFSSSARLASEEAILQCEEERFELDIVIETAKFTLDYFHRLNSYSAYPDNFMLISSSFPSIIRSTLIRWTL